MSSSSRDSESWAQGHGATAGDSSRSPAGERDGQIQAGCLAEEDSVCIHLLLQYLSNTYCVPCLVPDAGSGLW